jgi:type IV pilus assembly protein PilN
MRVNINLASHPYEDSGRFWLRWGAAIATVGALTIFLLSITTSGWISARKDRQIMAKYRAEIAERDQERSNAQALMNLPKNTSTRDRSQFLNDLFYRKAFSWTKVFEALEQVMPPGLHVVSIHPEAAVDNGLSIKLVVAGESRDRALELVRKMEGSQRFQQTEIEQEQSEVNTATPGDHVVFSITALYIPGVDTTTTTAANTARNP